MNTEFLILLITVKEFIKYTASYKVRYFQARCVWCTPIILASWEAEAGRGQVSVQPQQRSNLEQK